VKRTTTENHRDKPGQRDNFAQKEIDSEEKEVRPMIATILFLFQLLAPARNVQFQSWATVNAMHNLQAVQTVGDRRDLVYLYNTKANQPVPAPYVGIQPGPYWYSILRASVSWELESRGTYYTYSTTCKWFEVKRVALLFRSRWEGTAPCSGAIYLDGKYVKRITQSFTLDKQRMAREIFIQLDYDWTRVRGKRLMLPAKLLMIVDLWNGEQKHLEMMWSEYREFFTEVAVKESGEPN
jgi:hypothetical protein